MSLVERVEDLRETIESNGEDFESKIGDIESEIQSVVYSIEYDAPVDQASFDDWNAKAGVLDDASSSLYEIRGTLANIIEMMEEAANLARATYDAQEELGDDY